MSQLFVPIIVNEKLNEKHGCLFSVTCKTLENNSYSDINGWDRTNSNPKFFSVLDKKLENCFPNESFSFDVCEYGKVKKDAPLENFSENMTSISLGILCSAYAAKEMRNFKEKYDSITVTGNFTVYDGKIRLSDVICIKEKFQIVQNYASKNADKQHLFIYISSEEIIPDGLQENNVLVIRYDSGFPVECVFAEIFEDINEDTSTPQKYRNEFIETRAFIKLKKDFIMDKSCNCHIIKGKSNTGKSVAAEALCKYLVNSQAINGYVWFYIGDNGKFLELLRKEKEERTNIAFDIGLEGKHGKRNYVKEAYPEVFDAFERRLQADGHCAIVIDNIEHDIVDEVLEFFSRNYPMESNRYDLIITSWEGSKINRIESSIRTRTINISDISLDFKELKAIADSVLKINDYSKKYSEASENTQNELLNLLFKLCRKYPGYIPLVLATLNTYSINEMLELYAEKDINDLCIIERILKITFDQLDFLPKMVLFSYLQIRNFDKPLKTDEVIDIIKEKILNNASLIDKNGVQRAIKVLEQYSFLKEKEIGLYEIKSTVLHYLLFSQDMTDEVKTARDLIISPATKVFYAIEGKNFDEFAIYIDKIATKKVMNTILLKLCYSDSSLEFFQALLAKKDIDLNYTYFNPTPLQICAANTKDTKILGFLISKHADWRKCQKGETLLHFATRNENSTVLRYILEHHYYNAIDETDNEGWTALHWACLFSKIPEIIELLLKFGANKYVKSNNEFSLLHFAAMNEDETLLRYILMHHLYDGIDDVANENITPLHLACADNENIKSIELLLKHGANKNIKANDGETLLHAAVVNDNSTVLRYILERHYYNDIDETDNEGWTALHSACAFSKNIKSIELLLKQGANKNAKSNRGETLLHAAAENNDITILKYILDHHYYNDISEVDNFGRTALHLACTYSKNIKSIELLLEYGANKDARSNRGQILLHAAASNKDSTVLRYILKRHYYNNIDEPDNIGSTALHLACANSNDSKMIDLLLKYGADRATRNNLGQTILHCAALNEGTSMLKYILEHHYYSEINETDNAGQTSIQLACISNKNTKSIELLLEYGADKKSKGNSGVPLLLFAASNKYSTVLNYILDNHFYDDINESDNDGNTVLFFAETLESFKLLLEHGANPQIVTSKGNNILHAAVLSNKKEIVEYIFDHLPMIDPAQKNQEGKTPADLATSDEIKKLLEK